MEILGGSFLTSFPKLACNQPAGKATKFCSPHDMGLSLCFSKNSTLPKPHFVLVGESAHQSILPRFASSLSSTIWNHPANNISQSGSAA
ncbi:hypothetical protein AVEN_50761-1 [Araneus ventricosus]|uniref:Uncharacterized protein n=1 Tax=Araneus ventricosus TaxID=182803 RepID=A0A4Y2MZM9_ARAVE|nr:hypothetical protein AVEN_50761-1 [Araneus ventricosus]